MGSENCKAVEGIAEYRQKYWGGSTVPWERKQGSGRKNNVLTDEHLKFISECLEEDEQAPKKQRDTAHRIFTRLCEEKGYTGCESVLKIDHELSVSQTPVTHRHIGIYTVRYTASRCMPCLVLSRYVCACPRLS